MASINHRVHHTTNNKFFKYTNLLWVDFWCKFHKHCQQMYKKNWTVSVKAEIGSLCKVNNLNFDDAIMYYLQYSNIHLRIISCSLLNFLPCVYYEESCVTACLILQDLVCQHSLVYYYMDCVWMMIKCIKLSQYCSPLLQTDKYSINKITHVNL